MNFCEKKYNIIKYLFCVQSIITMVFPLMNIPSYWSLTLISGCGVMIAAFLMIFGYKNIWNIIIESFANYNRFLLVFLLVFSVLFIVDGAYFREISFIEIGVIFFAGVPICEQMVKKEPKLLELLCEGIAISFVILGVVTVFFGPGLTPQYEAIYGNTNTLGFFCLATNTATLYLYRLKQAPRYIVLLMVSTSLGLLSLSRTFIIAVFLQFVCAIIFSNSKLSFTSINWKQLLKKVLVFLLSFIAVVFSLTVIKIPVNKAIPDLQVEYQMPKISLRSYVDRFSDRITQGDDGNVDDLTSGRTMIWKVYIKNIGLKGHPDVQLRAHDGERYYKAARAHNAILEVAFYTGIIGGVAFLLYFVALAIKVLKEAFQRRKEKNLDSRLKLILDVSIAFVIVNMTATVYVPFVYILASLFWISIGLVVFENKSSISEK